jgi:hypothetical protein
MRAAIFGLCFGLIAVPAVAKQESAWVEKVAILAVGQGVCRVAIDDDTMQTAVGTAMITLALSKSDIIERGRTRAHAIVADLATHKTERTFCQAFNNYLQNGYPR